MLAHPVTTKIGRRISTEIVRDNQKRQRLLSDAWLSCSPGRGGTLRGRRLKRTLDHSYPRARDSLCPCHFALYFACCHRPLAGGLPDHAWLIRRIPSETAALCDSSLEGR